MWLIMFLQQHVPYSEAFYQCYCVLLILLLQLIDWLIDWFRILFTEWIMLFVYLFVCYCMCCLFSHTVLFKCRFISEDCADHTSLLASLFCRTCFCTQHTRTRTQCSITHCNYNPIICPTHTQGKPSCCKLHTRETEFRESHVNNYPLSQERQRETHSCLVSPSRRPQNTLAL